MDFLKDNKVVLTIDPIMEQAFHDWALRFCGIDEKQSEKGYVYGYSFAEREAFRNAVEKMLD